MMKFSEYPQAACQKEMPEEVCIQLLVGTPSDRAYMHPFVINGTL